MTTPTAYQGDAILKGVTYSTKGGYCARFEIEEGGWQALKALDGGHFAMVLVPVASDGTPDRDAVEKAAGGRRKRAQQAGIVCNETAFWLFLSASFPAELAMVYVDQAAAADFVREHCGVTSRSELDTNANAGQIWDDLKARYDLWLRGIEA